MAGAYAKTSDEKKYIAESDLRTLIEAEKIKKDKSRFGAAMKCHKDMMAALQEIDEDLE